MKSEYLCPVPLLIFSPALLKKVAASFRIKPVVLNTKGVKAAFSTLSTLELYFRFFSCSWQTYIEEDRSGMMTL